MRRLILAFLAFALAFHGTAPALAQGAVPSLVTKPEYVSATGASLNPPSTLAAGTSWTSALQAGGTYAGVTVSATISQAGVLYLQRYLDDAGTIPQGGAVQTPMSANSPATLNVTDNAPFKTWKLTISNTTGAAATVSNVGYLLTRGGAAGGYVDMNNNVTPGVVPMVNGAPVSAANPLPTASSGNGAVQGTDAQGAPASGNPLVGGVTAGNNAYRMAGDSNGRLGTFFAPTDNGIGSITQVTGYAVTALLAKATGGNLYRAQVKNMTTTAGCAYVLNRTTVPSTGNLSTTEILDFANLAANGEATFAPATFAERYATGIVFVVSSGACAATPTYSTTTPVTSLIRALYR